MSGRQQTSLREMIKNVFIPGKEMLIYVKKKTIKTVKKNSTRSMSVKKVWCVVSAGFIF